MQLAVAARAVNGAGVENFIARSEQCDLRPDLADNADSVPAQHLWLVTAAACTDFSINRVDGNGPDFDKQVPGTGFGGGQFRVVQRLWGVDRQTGLGVNDGLHWRYLQGGRKVHSG